MSLLFIADFQSKSQVFYSTDPQYILSKTEGNNLITSFNASYPDTALANFHQSFPINFMGNIGLASPNYLMKYGTDKIGFRFFEPPYKNDLFSENAVTYFKSQGPYASINGITGSKQFQSGKIFYTQTYSNKLTLSFKFNRYTSQGYYVRQQSYSNNFELTSHYTNSISSWGYYFYLINNGNKNQENGGIKNGVLNDSTVLINKQLMPIRLTAASRDNRQTKLMFNPWFKLTNKHDSISNTQHFLQIKSHIDFNSYKYKDAGLIKDKFYQSIYDDSIKTNDSSNFRQYRNVIAYNLKQKNQKINLSIGYLNEINKVWQKHDSVNMNHKLFSDFKIRNFDLNDTNINRSFESDFHVQYIIVGMNKGNYKFENNSVYFLNKIKKQFVYIDVLTEKRNADYIYNSWRSNHFVWSNKFAAQEQTQIQLGYSFNKDLQLLCLYQNIFKYLYFDTQAKPAQLKKTIENFAASISYTHLFFKHLGVAFAHIYQSTSKSVYYRVPENISTAKLFYNGNLFKNNLVLQIGAQASIYQSFKALNYMPSTQAFYLQSQSTTAALPLVDFYLNARIHPVSIFLKLENALQGFVGNNYSFVPGYYQTERAFRCGLTWMFFD